MELKFGRWCNGSTRVFDTLSSGSNPGRLIMSKKTEKVKHISIDWESIAPAIIVIVIVLCIGSGIAYYVSGSDEREAIAQLEYDLLRNQSVQISVHQPNKIEVYYEYIEAVHNGKTYSANERRYLVNSRFIINVFYINDRLYIKSDMEQKDYSFRNITYTDWNEAFLQLEERDYKGYLERDENMESLEEIPEEGED